MTKARRRGVAQTAPCAVVEPEYPVLRCALAGVPVDIGAAVAVDYLGDPWRRDIIDRFARVEIRRLAAAVGGDRSDCVAVARARSGCLVNKGCLGRVADTRPAVAVVHAVYAVLLLALESVPAYADSAVGAVKLADNGRRHEGVRPAVAVVIADEVAAAVERSDGEGVGGPVLEVFVLHIERSRSRDAVPAVRAEVEESVARGSAVRLPVNADTCRGVLKVRNHGVIRADLVVRSERRGLLCLRRSGKIGVLSG